MIHERNGVYTTEYSASTYPLQFDFCFMHMTCFCCSNDYFAPPSKNTSPTIALKEACNYTVRTASLNKCLAWLHSLQNNGPDRAHRPTGIQNLATHKPHCLKCHLLGPISPSQTATTIWDIESGCARRKYLQCENMMQGNAGA